MSLGHIALFLSGYNLICGLVYRAHNNTASANHCGLECSLWFIAAAICFK